MAVLAAAALLDELMGRNRNIAPTDKVKELNWEDPDYCKLYMVKFCPHDLFVNTRADLGQCPKVHDDEVKNLFEKSNSYKKQQYEDEFIRFCQSMLNEVGRKIVKGKQRLALIGKAEPVSISPAQTQKNEEQIKFLSAKINKLVEEAEAMGIQGNVEQAQGLMKLCDQLKEEREQLRGSNDNSHWQATAELAAAQEKQMEVCDVCGAFLIVGDAQQRIDDHLMGKQHVGYARLKQALQEITKQREEKDKKREEERRERSSKTRDDDRRRDKDRERERGERDRERDREREERRRKREEEERKRPRGGRGRSRSPRGHRHSSGGGGAGGGGGGGGGFHKRYHGDDKEGRRHKDDKRHRRSRSRDRKNSNKREEHHRSGKHTDKDRAANGEQHRSGSPHRRHFSSKESRSSHKHSTSGLGSSIYSENTENGDIGGCGGGGEQQS